MEKSVISHAQVPPWSLKICVCIKICHCFFQKDKVSPCLCSSKLLTEPPHPCSCRTLPSRPSSPTGTAAWSGKCAQSHGDELLLPLLLGGKPTAETAWKISVFPISSLASAHDPCVSLPGNWKLGSLGSKASPSPGGWMCSRQPWGLHRSGAPGFDPKAADPKVFPSVPWHLEKCLCRFPDAQGTRVPPGEHQSMNISDGRVRRTWKSLNHGMVCAGRDLEDHLV